MCIYTTPLADVLITGFISDFLKYIYVCFFTEKRINLMIEPNLGVKLMENTARLQPLGAPFPPHWLCDTPVQLFFRVKTLQMFFLFR